MTLTEKGGNKNEKTNYAKRRFFMLVLQEMRDNKKGVVSTKDMFNKIWQYVSSLDSLKEIIPKLDYAQHISYSVNKIPRDATFRAVVKTGGNEGIYIVLEIVKEDTKCYCGIIKTLDGNMDSYIYMGMLAGALTLAGDNYLWLNVDKLEK